MAKIEVRSGTEGPSHDPYRFTEITVTRTSQVFTGYVTFHSGLGEWTRVSDKVSITDDKLARIVFEHLAGITPEVALRAKHKIKVNRIRRHPCGMNYMDWIDGYPGETMLVCLKCGNVVDSRFDRSAVE